MALTAGTRLGHSRVTGSYYHVIAPRSGVETLLRNCTVSAQFLA